MIEILALTPEELQAWLDVLLSFVKDPIVLAILASVFGLPFLHPSVREGAKNMIPGNKPNPPKDAAE